ncbi:MAG: type II toxin-antitoxin system RelE/ParE family toxin [Deltaproteobacteria bacterium]|nr:type II toxin-antitoxin system RelE/ParE family toxin [Deltaproteobacteria bacterium]
MFGVRIAQLAVDHLATIRSYDRNRILDEIMTHLRNDPQQETPRRKQLPGVVPPFEHVQPVWQLRVGEFRVIYDVDSSTRLVIVRAVLRKGRRTTKEIL